MKPEVEIKSPTFSDNDVESPRNALALNDVAFAEWPPVGPNRQNQPHYGRAGGLSNHKDTTKKLEFPKINFNINLVSLLLNP